MTFSLTDMTVTDKPARRTQAERTELSEQLMLDAARDLILEIGTTATTLKEIGERAGYSRGLANARFGTKDVLFKKLADRCRENWTRTLQAAASDKHGLDALISRLDAMETFSSSHPNDARVMYILWFESVGTTSEIHGGLVEFHRQAREDISRLAREAHLGIADQSETTSQQFALHFCSLIFGVCYQWLVDPASVDLQETFKAIKKKLASYPTEFL